MPCYNCGNRAIAFVEPPGSGSEQLLLCLSCYERFMRLQQQQIENHERMINFAMDEIHAILPIGSPGPRFPPRRAPIISGAVLNHISVSNSVVGTINTGTIGSIDQAISALHDAGNREVASAIERLTQAIVESSDLPPSSKQDALDAIEVVALEAKAPEQSRKRGVARAMLNHLRDSLASAADLAEIYTGLAPIILRVFS